MDPISKKALKKKEKAWKKMRENRNFKKENLEISGNEIERAEAYLDWSSTSLWNPRDKDVVSSDVTHQELSIHSATEQIFHLDFGKISPHKTYVQMPMLMMCFFGIHDKDTGTMEVSLRNSSYINQDDQGEVIAKDKLGGMWMVIGRPNITCATEDVGVWDILVKVSNSTVSNVAIGKLIILARYIQTDLPISFCRHETIKLYWNPLDDGVNLNEYLKELFKRMKMVSKGKLESRKLGSLINDSFLISSSNHNGLNLLTAKPEDLLKTIKKPAPEEKDIEETKKSQGSDEVKSKMVGPYYG